MSESASSFRSLESDEPQHLKTTNKGVKKENSQFSKEHLLEMAIRSKCSSNSVRKIGEVNEEEKNLENLKMLTMNKEMTLGANNAVSFTVQAIQDHPQVQKLKNGTKHRSANSVSKSKKESDQIFVGLQEMIEHKNSASIPAHRFETFCSKKIEDPHQDIQGLIIHNLDDIQRIDENSLENRVPSQTSINVFKSGEIKNEQEESEPSENSNSNDQHLNSPVFGSEKKSSFGDAQQNNEIMQSPETGIVNEEVVMDLSKEEPSVPLRSKTNIGTRSAQKSNNKFDMSPVGLQKMKTQLINDTENKYNDTIPFDFHPSAERVPIMYIQSKAILDFKYLNDQ